MAVGEGAAGGGVQAGVSSLADVAVVPQADGSEQRLLASTEERKRVPPGLFHPLNASLVIGSQPSLSWAGRGGRYELYLWRVGRTGIFQ